MALPAGRSWLAELPQAERRGRIVKWFAIFAALLLFFGFDQAWLAGLNPSLGLVLKIGVAFFGNLFHPVQQMRGIATTYNKQVESSFRGQAKTLARLRLRERIEKWAFTALLISCAGRLTFLTLPALPDWGMPLTLVAAWLSVGVLLLNAFTTPGATRSWKSTYLLRTLIVPLSLGDPLFTLAMPFIHGVEHGMIFHKMWQRSSRRSSGFAMPGLLPLAGLALVVGGVALLRMRHGLGTLLALAWPAYANWIAAGSACSIAFAFMHIYLDAQIFRMRDPLVRKHIGPLLLDGIDSLNKEGADVLPYRYVPHIENRAI